MTEPAKRKCCDSLKGNNPHLESCINNPKNQGVRSVSRPRAATAAETEPDWTGQCELCGASPILPVTGMCGPCSFGEADTIGGNW